MRAGLLLARAVFGPRGGVLAAPAPQALLSRFLAGRKRRGASLQVTGLDHACGGGVTLRASARAMPSWRSRQMMKMPEATISEPPASIWAVGTSLKST